MDELRARTVVGEIVTIADAVAPHRASLEQLVRGEITPRAFRHWYFQEWRGWESYVHADVFEIVYRFEAIVDDYCDDPDLRETDDVDESTLLAGAWKLLAELDRELAGLPPAEISEAERVVPDPIAQLDRKVRRELDLGSVGLHLFPLYRIPGLRYRPEAERHVVFETVARRILDSGTARLTWNSGATRGVLRTATDADFGFDAWHWPWVVGALQPIEYLALTPPIVKGPPPLTAEQQPMANAWSTLRTLRPKPQRTAETSIAAEERRSMVKREDVTVNLTYDEAFALFELLHRWEDEDRVSEPKHKGEQIALWAISCVLEPKIAEVFDDDYDVSLRAALDRLAEGSESLDHLPD